MAETTRAAGLQKNGLSGQEGAVLPSVLESMPLPRLLRRLGTLHLFRGVLEDQVSRSFLTLLGLLAVEDDTQPARTALRSAYASFFSLLAGEVELRMAPLAGDPWQDHLMERLLADENPFSLKAQRGGVGSMGTSLMQAARHDLRLLRVLFGLDEEAVFGLLRSRLGEESLRLVPWGSLQPLPPSRRDVDSRVLQIKTLLAAEPHWETILEPLATHYAAAGTGTFAKYHAFRWTRKDGVGALEGIAHPDPISLEELVEYDLERALLLQNTEQFVEGYAANNALLYGDRGTGKSSTVKALLHRFGDRGLRLVEVPKGFLGDFPRILALLRGRRERFILFVDDLSFDEKETGYKELKAALEGSLEARPENVIVYATSNRRHIVQEHFSDRASTDGELRRWDTHQEKLSLSDRFGITLVFTTPDQGRYLRIVESLIQQKGLIVDPAAVRPRALTWATQQGGFSGRTARQFVDFLAGETGLKSRV